MTIAYIGTDHTRASLALRERLALDGARLDAVYAALRADPLIAEAAILSTCNRTEIYVAAYTLGYNLDRGLTAWRAYNVGHGGSLLHRAKDQVNTLLKGSSVPMAQGVNQRVLSAYLMKLAVKINRRPHPGKPGYRLDGARAQGQLTRMLLGTVGGFKLFLPVTTLPALPAKHSAITHPAAVHHVTAKPKHKKKKS